MEMAGRQVTSFLIFKDDCLGVCQTFTDSPSTTLVHLLLLLWWVLPPSAQEKPENAMNTEREKACLALLMAVHPGSLPFILPPAVTVSPKHSEQ